MECLIDVSRTCFIGLLALIAWTTIIPDAIAATRLRVGIYQNEPKIFINTAGKPSGILVEYLDEIARQEDWKIDYVPCHWATCLNWLASGKIDLMPDVARTPAREAQFSFHHEPSLNSWFQVYTHPGIRIDSVLGLDKRRIAVVSDSVEIDEVDSLEKGFGISARIIKEPDFDSAFRAVQNGQADMTIVNHFYGDYHADRFGLARSSLMFHPSRLYYATRKGHHLDILAKIDDHLRQWKSTPGSIYYRAIQQWAGESPRTALPRNVWWFIFGICALLLVALGIAYFLRWQVGARTRDLEQRNRELRDALEELEQTREKAIQQERLHVLGQMASGIAHDFNNSLMLILGHTELLKASINTGGASRQELIEQIEIIERASEDATDIVGRMRDFYRKHEANEPAEMIRIDKVASEVIQLTRPRWETQSLAAGASIIIDADLPTMPLVRASSYEVREALMNLIFNALDAMPQGGTLGIKTWSNERVYVEISDTGTGMSEAVREECMRPFYTTKSGSGTGMGLSMVAALMEKVEGEVSIESEEDKGTKFRLAFNRA